MSYTGAWKRLWGAIVPGPKGGLWVMLSPALDPSGQGSLAQVKRFFFLKQFHTKHSQSCGNPQRCNKK